MSSFIEQHEFNIPDELLKFILPSELHSAIYLEHLEARLAEVDKQLFGTMAINEDNAFVRISLLRQKRVAYVNAITQLKEY